MNQIIEFTIPAKTAKEAPLASETSLISGYILSISALFPLGCLGAVGVRLFVNGQQIAPLSPGWFTGNGNPPKVAMLNRLYAGPPWILRIEGYNKALDFAHTVNIDLSLGGRKTQ